ncbi:putative UDP-rhamnose:rhamnosyltransferase 1 [Aristolochia californica]|uniref:putative UDP-rhamnose:rhamnosyltransferase 1 n=1 Tax=Aristolochia californica TaxID=171875 RepID=UPI0035DEC275
MAGNYHIVLLPWLAFGHMLPFLELAKRLAAKGIHVSFISTHRNIKRLPPISPNLESRLSFVKIPLPQVEGLQESKEATIDLPVEQVPFLKMAYDGLKPAVEKLLEETLPDLIICDFVSFWVPEIAAKYGVLSAYFSVFSAATLAFGGPPAELKTGSKRRQPEDLMVSPDWFSFPSTVAHQGDRARKIHASLNVPDESGMSSGQRMAETIEGCDFITLRSCREFEGEYIGVLEKLYRKPVLPVGLLPPPTERLSKNDTERDAEIWSNTLDWLDRKTLKSVVFVGFGSEYKITRDQVNELAFGLELSELPFIWVLGMPLGVEDGLDILPQGFRTRVANRGMVCLGWAPQLEILAHPAIGGCLFHSGWGSILESLHHGHALILLPMIADQGLNSRLLVDKGVALEVERGEDGVSFTRQEIAKSMRHVMVDPAGEPLRQKAHQMRAIVANQELHESYIHQFLQHVMNPRERGIS